MVPVAVVEAGSTRLVVVSHGFRGRADDVINGLREVYERAGGPDYVEAHLYPSRGVMESILAGEALSLGVSTIAVYTVMHEAWRGYPRIHMVPDELAVLGGRGRALLVHEAFHSILHGSLEYYLVRVPSQLYELYGDAALIVAHVAATVVKDLEVHAAMEKHGYRGLLAHLAEDAGDCGSLEGLSDALKAATARLVLGEDFVPCGLVETVRALRELLHGEGRPWEKLEWFTLVFAGELKKRGHILP